MKELTELEKVLLRKLDRFQKEMDIMKDLIINGLQEEVKQPTKKTEKYNPVDDLHYFNDNDFQIVWKEYLTIRIKKKASNTDRAIKQAIMTIKAIAGNNKRKAIAIVDQSANSGWTGLFEPKDFIVKVEEKKETNTERYNFRKEAEENPEDYTQFNMSDVFKSIVKR